MSKIFFIVIAVMLAASAAPAQEFQRMSPEVQAFLTGVWVKTSGDVDRLPAEAEIAAAMPRCTEPMFDLNSEDGKKRRKLFQDEKTTHGDLSLFYDYTGAFVLAQRKSFNGATYSDERILTVGVVQTQGQTALRLIGRAMWVPSGWIEELREAGIWADGVAGETPIGGATRKLFVATLTDGTKATFIKCMD